MRDAGPPESTSSNDLPWQQDLRRTVAMICRGLAGIGFRPERIRESVIKATRRCIRFQQGVIDEFPDHPQLMEPEPWLLSTGRWFVPVTETELEAETEAAGGSTFGLFPLILGACLPVANRMADDMVCESVMAVVQESLRDELGLN